MTREPHTVSADEPAAAALSKMIAGRFRHVPVTSAGAPPALLDVTRCLFEVISRLEQAT